MTAETDAALHAEFASLTARAHLTIAPDRVEVMFEAFKALRALMSELDRPWAYADEPATVFRSPT